MPLDTRSCLTLCRAMQQEIRRSMRGLRLPSHPRPFFVSHLLHALDGLNVWGRYGAVFHTEKFRESDIYAEVRVGSHRFDQSIDGGLTTELSERESFNWLEGPEELTADAVRYSLWKLTQLKYEEALQDYYDKKKVLVEQHLAHNGADFSREEPFVHHGSVSPVRFPEREWKEFIRETSDLFRQHRRLADPFVRIRGVNRVRIFANSEGSHFICQETYYEVMIKAWFLTADGVYLSSAKLFYGRRKGELPTIEQVREAIDDLVRDLRELAKAAPLDPYAGPALLSGLASGLIFHEAIGHRLEGERMTSRSEGRTFASRIGQRVLPTGLDVWDDPTMKTFAGQGLYGHYEVDDEGIAARPVKLIDDGMLKTFLLSRSCVPGFNRSNGHGRHERYQDPMARMATLYVKNKHGHSWDELKAMLLEEVGRRDLSYGIIVRGVSGGETRTDRYDFQAFKGVPTEVYTVAAKTGKETRVRDVSFIGTPLAATQSILAFGRDYEVDNSYCWAESGSVPVSTIAPSMLVDELELQRSTTRLYRRPILPFPPMENAAPARKKKRPRKVARR